MTPNFIVLPSLNLPNMESYLHRWFKSSTDLGKSRKFGITGTSCSASQQDASKKIYMTLGTYQCDSLSWPLSQDCTLYNVEGKARSTDLFEFIVCFKC